MSLKVKNKRKAELATEEGSVLVKSHSKENSWAQHGENPRKRKTQKMFLQCLTVVMWMRL